MGSCLVPRDKNGGTYGWFVVGICFLFGVMMVNGYGCFGVFLVECVQRFDMSEKYLMWIGAFRFSLLGLSGIVVGGLTQRYGHHKTAIVGTVLLFCSHTACGMFPQLGFYWLLLTYGIFSGVGFGCITVVWATAFQSYFQKKSGCANAIVSTGISAGVFTWSPLLEFLFSTYGWTWALLLNAAILLHGVPLGLLLAHSTRKTGRMTVQDNNAVEPSPALKTKVLSDTETIKGKMHHLSLSQLCENEKSHKVQGTFSVTDVRMLNPHPLGTFRLGTSLISLAFDKDSLMEIRSLDASKCSSNPITQVGNNDVHYESHKDLQAATKHTSTEGFDCSDEGSNKAFLKHCIIAKMLQDVIDLSLFKNIPFLLYAIGLSITYFGGIVPIVLLPTRAVDFGIDRSRASFLVSILGIINVFSRLFWGNVSDIQRLSKYKPLISGGTAILDGVTQLLSFVAKDYISFAIFAAMWGFFSGGYSSLQNTLVVHILHGQNINKGAGTLLTVIGLLFFASFVLSGFLIDIFGNASTPFYVSGGVEVLGGILICCVTFF